MQVFIIPEWYFVRLVYRVHQSDIVMLVYVMHMCDVDLYNICIALADSVFDFKKIP